MNLVAGGDSFIFGTELQDQTRAKFSRHTFPALLASSVSWTYTCVAHPGIANSSIARRVMTYCEQHSDIENFVVVMWTFPNRYEFRFAGHTGNCDDRWESITPWVVASESEIKETMRRQDRKVVDDQLSVNSKLRKSGVVGFANSFLSHVGSSKYWEIYSTLKEMIFLQNYLTVKKIPYLFTVADNCVLTNYTHSINDSTVDALYQQLDMSRMFLFPGSKGFYQWALENKYEVGVTHPLERAHIDAFNLIKEKINELVTHTA